MARKPQSQPRRRPSAPPPSGAIPAPLRQRPAGSFASSGGAGGAFGAGRATSAARPLPAAAENLDESYAHVKRDLRRIVVFAALLFAGIYGSRFLF